MRQGSPIVNEELQIETPRLLLRLPVEADLDEWAAMAADPALTAYIGGPQPYTLVWRTLATMRGSWALRGYGLFSVIERESGRWAGCVGPWHPPGWPGHEVGWRLAAWATGKGYATEAARRACDWAHEYLGWSEILHPIHPDNAPSIRVAQRLGAISAGPIEMPPPFDKLPTIAWIQRY